MGQSIEELTKYAERAGHITDAINRLSDGSETLPPEERGTLSRFLNDVLSVTEVIAKVGYEGNEGISRKVPVALIPYVQDHLGVARDTYLTIQTNGLMQKRRSNTNIIGVAMNAGFGPVGNSISQDFDNTHLVFFDPAQEIPFPAEVEK